MYLSGGCDSQNMGKELDVENIESRLGTITLCIALAVLRAPESVRQEAPYN